MGRSARSAAAAEGPAVTDSRTWWALEIVVLAYFVLQTVWGAFLVGAGVQWVSIAFGLAAFPRTAYPYTRAGFDVLRSVLYMGVTAVGVVFAAYVFDLSRITGLEAPYLILMAGGTVMLREALPAPSYQFILPLAWIAFTGLFAQSGIFAEPWTYGAIAIHTASTIVVVAVAIGLTRHIGVDWGGFVAWLIAVVFYVVAMVVFYSTAGLEYKRSLKSYFV